MSEWFHTLILIIHVLGAALIIGVAFSAFIIQQRRPVGPESLKIIGGLYKSIQIVFLTQLLSGLYLAWSEMDKLGKNPLLGIKFILFVFVAGMATFLLRNDKKKLAAGGQTGAHTTWTWVSLLILLTITTLGVVLAESAQ